MGNLIDVEPHDNKIEFKSSCCVPRVTKPHKHFKKCKVCRDAIISHMDELAGSGSSSVL